MTMMMALIALQIAAGGTAPPATLSGDGGPPPVARPILPAPVLPAKPSVPSSAAPRPDRMAVLAAVDAEWRRYDVRGTGRLGPLEFATWVVAANGGLVAPAGVKDAKGIGPVSAMNATARAFARADANHDGGVTREEMADFLMR